MIISICDDRISVAVFFTQQYYSEHISCHYYADVLLMSLS